MLKSARKNLEQEKTLRWICSKARKVAEKQGAGMEGGKDAKTPPQRRVPHFATVERAVQIKPRTSEKPLKIYVLNRKHVRHVSPGHEFLMCYDMPGVRWGDVPNIHCIAVLRLRPKWGLERQGSIPWFT